VFLLISINAFLRLRADARRKPRAATDEDAARADTAIVHAG
jgi:hypothetical protein